ncbi:phenylacetate--CoA ligase family protein [Rariglobus hedericola]|uniref:Phenylacetate--CoA ligase n=1 Tax=Rariglobus hedericola TaxID=2597822 RepID=A0A556QEL2_9BACT|nr:AMP-binding protein [Rariglobus hedericola]TSJ75046.1 phenylacetate--CoA ligase [Rariglobus hedericola]
MPTPRCTHHWQDLDRDSTIAWQGQQLHRYLRDCVLPFSLHYQRLFKERGLTAADIRSVADLSKIPFTTKEDLLPTKENPKRTLDFVLKPDPKVLSRRLSVILWALRHGREQVRDELDHEWRPVFMTSTTGRSSEPVPFLYTQHDIARLGLGGGRIVEIGGVRSEERMVNMFPFAPHLAFWYMYYAGMDRNIFALATGGGKVMGTEGNLRAVVKLKPQVIVAMPTFLYHVLQQAVEQNLKLEGIRLLVLGGDKVPDGTRRKLGDLCKKLGSPDVQIMATYGFTECKLAWTECPITPGTPPPGYHLYADQGIIEIINPETGEVMPDGQGGEIVWTPLDQRGTVVLRYRTGDRCENGITWDPCPCCGRRMPRLVGKISRVSDVHSLRFQKVKGTIVDFNELERALDDLPELGAWQIELRKAHDDPLDLDELNVHVSPATSGNTAGIEKNVRELLHAHFELTPNKIVTHTEEEMRTLQKVGVALKEQKVVDNRSKASATERSGTAEPFRPKP